ncbi:MAG: glycosyltransferase, partial [Bacillota bacterium]
LPVVSTDVSNISEIVVDGKTGYLAESKNPEDIKNKMLIMMKIYEKDKLAKNGREIIKNNFTLNKMIKKIKYFLEDSLNE